MKLVTPFPDFIEALAEVDVPIEGVRGWMVQGSAQQVVFLQFDRTVEVPEHSHSEQWEFPLAGRAELRIHGETFEYGAGENFYIPAGVPHAATVHSGYRAMIVFNEPARYTPKG